MLKGEPVDEAELQINQPPRENPDLLTQKHIIEAENPELSQGVNPYEGVDIQQVPNTKIVNDIRFPGTSVLNQGNSISNNQNNINDLDPNLSPMPYDINNVNNLEIDKIERQIRKNKTRIKKNYKEVINFVSDIDSKEEEDTNTIVKRKTVDMKPMNEEEALLQMNLLGHDFFVFKNTDTNTVSVIYKRKDGAYGIIETK